MDLTTLTRSEKLELITLLEERDRREAGRKLFTYYPDTGPLRRELYPKHLQFFAAGIHHRERAVMAANRTGKTEGCLGFETAVHLTGLYPDWWQGYRFNRPINALCGGDTSTTTRDILVRKLLGPPEDRGTGLVPRNTLGRLAPAMGVPNHIDFALVKHVSGKDSVLQFRSYDQGREAWQGTERDWIGLDEEPPIDIYTEALLRTATTRGLLVCTFTPLKGISDVVLSFMPEFAPAA